MHFFSNKLTVKRVTGGVRFMQAANDLPYREDIDVTLSGPDVEALIYALRISMKMQGIDNVGPQVVVRPGLSAIADRHKRSVLTLDKKLTAVHVTVSAARFADALELMLATRPEDDSDTLSPLDQLLEVADTAVTVLRSGGALERKVAASLEEAMDKVREANDGR